MSKKVPGTHGKLKKKLNRLNDRIRGYDLLKKQERYPGQYTKPGSYKK